METKTKNSYQYGRVSTPEQLTSGDSLTHQDKVTKNEAIRRGINPTNFYGDTISGSSITRDGYDQMFFDLKKANSKIQTIFYVIIKCIDRYTRGGAEFYIMMTNDLKKLNVQLIDVAGIIQEEKNSLEDKGFTYEWSKYRPSETAELIEAQKGKGEKRDILTRTIGAQISLTQKGFRMGSPLDGMRSETQLTDGKNRIVFVRKDGFVHFIEKIFEMRASGVNSDLEIISTLNAMGYKSPIRNRWSKNREKHLGQTGGGPLDLKRLEKIYSKVGYCGILLHKWNKYLPINGQIEKIISIEVYNKANKGKRFIVENSDGTYEIKTNYNPIQSRPRLEKNPLYPYAKVVKCQFCGLGFKYSAAKGKNKKKSSPGYHCSYKHEYFRKPKKEFEDTIENYLKSLSLTDAFVEKMQKELVDTFSTKSGELKNKFAKIFVNIADLKAEQEKYISEYIATNNPIIKSSIESKINKIEEQIKNATDVGEENEVEELNVDEFLAYTRNFLKDPSNLVLEEKTNVDTVGVLFSLIFEEKPTYNNILYRTPKLTSVFKHFSANKQPENQLGCPMGIEPILGDPQTPVITISLWAP